MSFVKEAELARALSDVLQKRGKALEGDASIVAEAKKLLEKHTVTTRSPTLFNEVHVLHALARVVSTLSGVAIDAPTTLEEVKLCWLFLGILHSVMSSEERDALNVTIFREAVELHYTVCKPPMFDIFAHLSANEMFFFDGDSLLMEALCKPLVDWDLMQAVHVNFFVQRILQELLSRGARFHVIFFDSSRWIWNQSPQKLFLRELVKDSLLNLASKPQAKFVVKCFSSWYAPEYKKHFDDFDPEFVMMTDGEQMADQSQLQLGYELHPGSSNFRSVVEDTSVGSRAALYYHCFMVETICCHAQVVFSSRLIFKDNAVVAFVVRSSSDRFAQYLMLQNDATELAKSLANAETAPLPQLSLSAEKIEALQDKDLFVCFRERVVAGAILGYLDAKERTEVEFSICKALWIATVCTSVLPAEARSQPVVRQTPELKEFMDAIAPFLLAAVKHVGVHTGLGQEFDPIDGHLLFAFVRMLRTTAPSALVSADLTAAIQDVWTTFIEEKDSIIDAPIAALPDYPAPPKVENIAVPPIKHELVTALAKTFSVTVPEGDAYPSGIGAANNLRGWDVAEPFDEHNDVINVGRIEDTKEDARNNTRAQDRQLKMEARRVAVTQENAESLGAALFLGSGETLASVVDRKDDGSDAPKERRSHATTRKAKFVRTSADRIREENNLRLVKVNNARHIRTLVDLLNRSERFNESTRQSDRENVLFSLKSNMDQFRIDESLIHENEVVTGDGFSKVEVWRALVALSKRTERETALDAELSCFETAKLLVAEEHKKFTANLKKKDGQALEPELLRFAFMENDKERHDGKDVATRFVQQLCLFFVEAHYLAAAEQRVLRLVFHEWQQERESARLGSRKADVRKAVKLFICVHKVITRIEVTGIRLPTEDVSMIRSAVRHLEFNDAYNQKVDQMIAQFQGLAVGSLPENLKPRHKLLEHTVERFQLCEMGELLERPIPPFRDSRVSFKPDAWQKDLLDIVDNRGSAVVCAPTSAGKTFISFYCMKAALMTSNDRIVVYVAPTRALINQAVADVCARFGTKKYANPGLHVYGALGGDDYHHDHDTCQVLITLPEVFETMLMSPKYIEWSKRIDYVIFDEIHSMESSGNGPVWERILSLTTSPFIALSATLGETTQLCGWLNRIQRELQANNSDASPRRDYSVSVIPKLNEKIQRWNDIEKYVYQPPQGCEIPFQRTDRPFEFEHIRHLHPLSTVTLTMLRGKFPPDLSLVPKESVALYDIMVKEYTPFIESYADVDAFVDVMRVMESLKPEVYFSQDRHIVQKRARMYEATIKDELLKWAQLGVSSLHYTLSPLAADEVLGFREDMTEIVQNVLAAFQQHLKDGEEELKQYSLAVKDVEKAPFPNSIAFVKKHIFNVLRELKDRDRAPTIVFSFESEDCELLVEHVVSTLEQAEAAYRATPEFEQHSRAMQLKREEAETRNRTMHANQERPQGRGDDEGRTQERERNVEVMPTDDGDSFVIPDVLPQFAFFGKGEYNHRQFTKIMDDCQERGSDLFARALRRGICIHHAGVAGKLRGHSERMFRSLYCSVIFATETLALGVHSPCRSVVLAGDHILLNTTQFRQMMGRAGRRGLDNLGHLIFMGVSLKKVNRVMTSDLMVIKGHVQVDAVTQLRLLQLHDFEKQRDKEKKDYQKWKDEARHIAARLFANPLYFLGRERMNGNMEGFQIRLFQALLRYFHSEGLHFSENDGTSSLGSLITTVTHVFRNAGSHISGFLFANLLTANALADVRYTNNIVEASPEATFEAEVEALAYVFSVHTMFNIPMELHRSALRNPETGALWHFPQRKFPRLHRVALTPLRHLNLLRVESRKKAVMALLSAFYTKEAALLPEAHDNCLPFMTMKFKDASKQELVKFKIFAEALPSDETEEPVVATLMRTAAPYKARHPIAAVCGSGDGFRNLEELSLTLRDDGLFADIGMFPLVDYTDNSRHEGSQVVLNACVADFVRCGAQTEDGEYRRTFLQTLNGLSQAESYHALDRVEMIMSNLVMSKPTPASKIRETLRAIQPEDLNTVSGKSAVATIAVGDRLSHLRRQIDNQAYLDRRDQDYERRKEENQNRRRMAAVRI